MKKLISRVSLVFALSVIAYVLVAFVVTPPYSPHGVYAVPGCLCGHHSFVTVEGGKLILYRGGHNLRVSLGDLMEKDGVYTATLKGLSPLNLQFSFWGCFMTADGAKKSEFYLRDFLFPLALLTKYQTKISEQSGPPNSHAFGTFGTSAAEQPLVPKAGGSR